MLKQKILVIEDEKEIREAFQFMLSNQYEVDFAENGVEGIKKAIRNVPDLILLDLKMPEMDGFQTCKILREDPAFDSVPIVVISAFNSTVDRTRSFELGADDYISKPFDRSELSARIQRKIKNFNQPIKTSSSSDVLVVDGGLSLDLKTQVARIGQNELPFSAIEFKILHLLTLHYSELVNRATIIDWVWEKQAVSPRLIDPHILSLRNKLNGQNFIIQSVYGKGYVLKKI